ncbi:Gfo/Idh/MocA family oxidoreductase [Nocardia sp. NPDC049737]|uniref:Gfo/Idh/MocA family protein n=1 Tax=Nocardia sp. NPDC049737 TaxID=3154358 RepID=UPI003428CB07
MTLRVGLIGCGRIGTEGHLPAYALGEVTVSAVCDLDLSRARRAAESCGAAVESDAIALARRGDVDVVDVATRPGDRAALIRTLLDVGKPLLVQKPVLYDLAEARELAREVRQAGLAVAVNHNARWAPTHARVRGWIEAGRLGQVYAVHHANRFNEDLAAWYTDHPDYLFLDHGLHYLDLVRYLTGRTPTTVSARAWAKPGQHASCPLAYAITLGFDDTAPLTASLSFNNAVPAPGGFHYRLDIDGVLGSAGADLEHAWLVSSDGVPVENEKCGGAWVPDGILGAYRAFEYAVETGAAPPHSLDDHLRSLAVATAAADSARADGAWTRVEQP